MSYAPLEVVAAAYKRAGAEVFNLPEATDRDAVFHDLPPGPLATLIDHWLAYVNKETTP